MISFGLLGLLVLTTIIVVAALLVLMTSIRKGGRAEGGLPHPSEIDADGRMLLKPLRELHEALQTLVAQNQHVPEISVVGHEALLESDRILDHASRLVTARGELKKTLRGRVDAQTALLRLERQAESAQESERASLAPAIEARRLEVSHYDKVDETLRTLDGRLRSAEAALAELKARLALGAADTRARDIEGDSLGDMVGRLKSLGASFDEAERMLEQHSR